MDLITTSVSEPFLYLFSSKNGSFHKFLYRNFDIQGITLTFTFQNGGTSREWG